MQKIGSITSTADANGEWTNGNVAAGTAPTILDAAWLNTIQREIANVVTGAGLTLNPANDAQLLEALFSLTGPGRLLNVQVFKTSGTYTPTYGTKKIRTKVLSGGGAGGGGAVTTSSQVGVAAGGNSGAYAESNIIDATTITTVVVTVGAGGSSSSGAAGGNGGASSFGTYIVCPGGAGGYAGVAGTPGICGPDNGNVSAPTGTAVSVGVPTRAGTGPFTLGSAAANGIIKSGRGGDSPMGTGGYGITGLYGAIAGSGYGAGGGGAAVGLGSATAQPGGSGSNGIVFVEEYS